MKSRIAIVGPVFPYRAGIAYCTTRLATQLSADVISFKRQYPKRFYPGGDDIDPTLPRAHADFVLDILNPMTWVRAGRQLRKYDAVVFVWWIWVWAVPYLVMMRMLPRGTNVILQCHNIGDKEPARWKSWLTNRVLRRARSMVVHSEPELADAVRRSGGRRVVKAHLPVHELGGDMPPRAEAKRKLGLGGKNVALFFGHIRPFKGLDIAEAAWPKLHTNATLLVAGEPWWKTNLESRTANLVIHARFIPDSEIATYFAAADVGLAPYRIEAQSGVILTAFHFARPVIATRVGGIPEIVRDGVNGYLIPAEDPDALARAVDRFFTEANRPAMERAAAERAKTYSWEDYGKVFTRLVERP